MFLSVPGKGVKIVYLTLLEIKIKILLKQIKQAYPIIIAFSTLTLFRVEKSLSTSAVLMGIVRAMAAA